MANPCPENQTEFWGQMDEQGNVLKSEPYRSWQVTRPGDTGHYRLWFSDDIVADALRIEALPDPTAGWDVDVRDNQGANYLLIVTTRQKREHDHGWCFSADRPIRPPDAVRPQVAAKKGAKAQNKAALKAGKKGYPKKKPKKDGY